MIFRCWDPDTACREDSAHVQATTPDRAAEYWAQNRYGHDDYPQARHVLVEWPDGKLSAYRVIAEPSVDFRAAEVALKDVPRPHEPQPEKT